MSAIDEHRSHLERTGGRDEARRNRALELLDAAVDAKMRQRFMTTRTGPRFEEIRADVADRRIDPWTAAALLVRGETSQR